MSFQLLSSILAHSRIECNQDCQRSMLLDGLKQAFSSIMYSPTSVPSTPTTNEVYYGADPVYSRSHSSMLHENKEQPNTGCTVPVRRHLSCVGFTDSLSPVSLIDSPTHNLSEAHNMFPRPSESGPYFSESCPSHINIDHVSYYCSYLIFIYNVSFLACIFYEYMITSRWDFNFIRPRPSLRCCFFGWLCAHCSC